MIVSYTLLQTFFREKLPKPEALADLLTFHAFEIEGMEKKGKDTLIDVKILPNRAHDCLSHVGIAREIGAICGIPFTEPKIPAYPKSTLPGALSVTLSDPRARRYIGLVLDGIEVGDSPLWLRDALVSLGQRSINNVVDATNYVMFMTGQPLHAFDHSKLSGGKIVVRPGKAGESLTTLDGKTVALDSSIMVIADTADALALAGIKGGTKAEVDCATKTVVLESANFDASTIRLTAQRVGIKTDASKRFESGLSPATAEEAMRMLAALLMEIGGKNIRAGKPTDRFPAKSKARTLTVSLAEITRLLGITVLDAEVRKVWKSLGFQFTAQKGKDGLVYKIEVPHARLDLTIKEDLIEEVGRMRGYHDLPLSMPVEVTIAPEVNRAWHARETVRDVMVAQGFSDVYTYSFFGAGEIEVANPIAADKKYLRNNLMNALKDAVAENLKYESEVRIFEFGHIFGKANGKITEEESFAALMGFQKRKEAQMKEDFFFLKGVVERVAEALRIEGLSFAEAGGELVASVTAVRRVGKRKEAETVLLGMMSVHGFELDFAKMLECVALSSLRYSAPSRFPSMVRDVSLFVPIATRAGDVEAVIRAHAGALIRMVSLIDVFEKPEEAKKSLAFRMVLQSDERTLSDEEANAVVDRVIDALRVTDAAWQVRV